MPQSATPARIAVVASRWHADIVDRSVEAFGEVVEAAGHPAPDVVHVPGAFEIPLTVQRLARSGGYDAIAAVGLVVNGGIYQHEYVASAVISGLMQVQLATGVPVLSGVLTPLHFHEHEEHVAYFTRHFRTKGAELGNAALAVLAAADPPAGS
ncbi:6,7-dimethyl-8-ribityllumazine synthase [Blastococcus sp. TML/C7B]|uniref:6,7-dimethyl-8-ribityllumazine synthase n=1 Tax=Blastococcus sp. TML/C7B TaxID=2798728 RepID=UPI00190B324D|nr:6,7-dimethyl-8-ribityllumazine synthase [Blastococcus sp. TML/C7B]MBN1097669.1 6,7-dimethyl-8-ribityllumazine synthase [Blastococcus sp. TML/C7B]